MPDILLTRRDSVAVVSLNRPEVRNAVTLNMWRELASMFSGLAGDDEIRAVVLTQFGLRISASAPMCRSSTASGRTGTKARHTKFRSTPARPRSRTWRKPVIAAISGYCLGGGCHLALACDFRFADHTAKLGIPSAKLSIVYGVKSVQRLLAIAGIANAKRMLYSGRALRCCARLTSMGLVDEICDDAKTAAVEYAATLAGNAPLSIAGAKFMLNGLSMGDGALDVAAAQRMIDLAADSEDFREGRLAFAEKRAPRFRGR